MANVILVLNAGSSSLKFSIYRVDAGALTPLARGKVDGFGGVLRLTAKDRRGDLLADADLRSTGVGQAEAFGHLARWAAQQFGEELTIAAVGHRIAHGGAEFSGPALIDQHVVEKLEALVPLAPLDMAHNLEMVRAVSLFRSDLPQVACFDTAFHRGRAAVTERFGLPDDLHRAGVRRWGFHGLSYASVIDHLALAAPDVAASRVVIAHLGMSASLCAVRNGQSVDTTTGFSTLDGLPMGTQCGALDPGVLLFLLRSHTPKDLEALLYNQSGMLGISGSSGDVRDLLASDNPRAAQAIEFLAYRVIREIGSMAAAMGGLDAVVFTADVGESSPVIRQLICRGLAWLGVALEPTANERGRLRVSPMGRSPSVWVIPSDEELMIATDTLELLGTCPATATVSAGRSVPGGV